jgi:hypothetical protein
MLDAELAGDEEQVAVAYAVAVVTSRWRRPWRFDDANILRHVDDPFRRLLEPTMFGC